MAAPSFLRPTRKEGFAPSGRGGGHHHSIYTGSEKVPAPKLTEDEKNARLADRTRTVAYLQNLKNKFPPMAVMNMLLANDFILQDKEFLRLAREAVLNSPDVFTEAIDLDEELVLKRYFLKEFFSGMFLFFEDHVFRECICVF